MRHFFVYLLTGTFIAALVLLAFSYSLTFTPIGRIEYGPAVLAFVSRFVSTPEEYTPDMRATSNELGRKNLGPADRELLASVEDFHVGNGDLQVPVRVYKPPGDGPFPLVLEIHGGGFFMGNDFVLEANAINFAAAIPAVVVSVDYRLAPENPFPAALEDCYVALIWIADNASRLNGDHTRLALMGESAGGNLVAALTLKVRDEGGPSLRYQYLLNPVTDLVGKDWQSFRELGDNYLIRVSDMPRVNSMYVPNEPDRLSPYASPLLADAHTGLPEALIVTSQFDPLRDQGKAYADRLRDAGVKVTYVNVEGNLHGFVGSPGSRRKYMAYAAAKMREALYR